MDREGKDELFSTFDVGTEKVFDVVDEARQILSESSSFDELDEEETIEEENVEEDNIEKNVGFKEKETIED